MMNVLVIGYGNPLRQDDGLGWHVAEQLAFDFDQAHDIRIEVCHQLTPELAEPISRASRVLFIDVDIRLAAGTLVLAPLHPDPTSARPSTHHVEAGWLLTLAERLFGQRPKEAALLRLGPAGLDHSQTLTDTGAQLLATAVGRAKSWIGQA